MRSVENHLREKCKDPRFRELFEMESEKAKVAALIVRYRADHHLSQSELAHRVGVTQQQISKIEEGDFSNLSTIQKVLLAVGHRIEIHTVPLDPRTRRIFQKAA